MHVTLWGEYGIHCCTFLAGAFPEHLSAPAIAEALGIEVAYTHQILHRLRQAGLVASHRGPRGGYALSRSPSDISVWDVLIATEGETFRLLCETKPIQEQCGVIAPCALQRVWSEVRVAVDQVLKHHSIASLLGKTPVTGDSLVQISGGSEGDGRPEQRVDRQRG